MAEGIPKRDYDGLIVRPRDHQLQVTVGFNSFAELPKLICHRLNDSATQVGKHNRHVAAHDLRVRKIQKLSGDHDAPAAGLNFELQINLKRIRAIEHLSHSCARRASALEHRVQKTIEQHFKQVAGSFQLLCQKRTAEGCL